ncbi:MAG: PA2779 family protein [Candidatus Omnitrophica bacterium]|nr:PA2779 family protein [Candidatus Omnitrophota bacterium]
MFLERLLEKKGILMLMLAIAMLCGISPANSIAMPIDSQIVVSSSQQVVHIAKIQNFLNKSMVQNRLAKLGLSKESAMQYISTMDEAQLAKLSTRIESIDKAGDGTLVVVIILLIAFIFLYMTDSMIKLEPRRGSKSTRK